MMILPPFIRKLRDNKRKRASLWSSPQSEEKSHQQPSKPAAEEFPTFPPPSPQDILRDPEGYWATVNARKYAAPRGVFEDSSLYVLYRLYECIVLDKVFGYRNILEQFWRQSQWPISQIPDPEDADPARYAFLAGVTYLMVRSFNARVSIGLTRGMRPIMMDEEIEEARNRPDSERPYEHVPTWAANVPSLAETLSIPTHDGVLLDGKEDERADPDFLAKNILLWTPHIHFT
ncbi:hypothetical protein FQN54_001171 [Arachnomyces sp. PD_36]|nr:hypothetical protein FQN54_001171 [Arachnomyces sp. PD_36]